MVNLYGVASLSAVNDAFLYFSYCFQETCLCLEPGLGYKYTPKLSSCHHEMYGSVVDVANIIYDFYTFLFYYINFDRKYSHKN